MSYLTILDVVLGLIFLWLVSSLAVMGVQEWIASRKRWRATMLETTIHNMLGDAALTDQFYNHPLIRSMYSGKDGETKPSYIPASQFTLALFDIVINASTEASLLQQQLYRLRYGSAMLGKRKRRQAEKRLNLLLAIARRVLVSNVGDVVDAASTDELRAEIQRFATDFPSMRTLVGELLTSVDAQKKQIDLVLAEMQRQMGGSVRETTLLKLREGVMALGVTHTRLKQSLYALINGVEEYVWQGESALGRVRSNVEEWFTGTMDRLSGWYKRRTTALAFILGLFFAMLFNADSLRVAGQLWREPVLRDLLSIQADKLAQSTSEPSAYQGAGLFLWLQDQSLSTNLPIGWIGYPVEWTGDTTCSLVPQAESDVLGFMLGRNCYPIINTPLFYDWTGWLMKFAGLLITAAASAQGAPFWFDVLKKIMNVRSSGANPTETSKAVG